MSRSAKSNRMVIQRLIAGRADDQVAVVAAKGFIRTVYADRVRCDPAGKAHKDWTLTLGSHAQVAMCVRRLYSSGFVFVVEV